MATDTASWSTLQATWEIHLPTANKECLQLPEKVDTPSFYYYMFNIYFKGSTGWKQKELRAQVCFINQMLNFLYVSLSFVLKNILLYHKIM